MTVRGNEPFRATLILLTLSLLFLSQLAGAQPIDDKTLVGEQGIVNLNQFLAKIASNDMKTGDRLTTDSEIVTLNYILSCRAFSKHNDDNSRDTFGECVAHHRDQGVEFSLTPAEIMGQQPGDRDPEEPEEPSKPDVLGQDGRSLSDWSYDDVNAGDSACGGDHADSFRFGLYDSDRWYYCAPSGYEGQEGHTWEGPECPELSGGDAATTKGLCQTSTFQLDFTGERSFSIEPNSCYEFSSAGKNVNSDGTLTADQHGQEYRFTLAPRTVQGCKDLSEKTVNIQAPAFSVKELDTPIIRSTSDTVTLEMTGLSGGAEDTDDHPGIAGKSWEIPDNRGQNAERDVAGDVANGPEAREGISPVRGLNVMNASVVDRSPGDGLNVSDSVHLWAGDGLARVYKDDAGFYNRDIDDWDIHYNSDDITGNYWDKDVEDDSDSMWDDVGSDWVGHYEDPRIVWMEDADTFDSSTTGYLRLRTNFPGENNNNGVDVTGDVSVRRSFSYDKGGILFRARKEEDAKEGTSAEFVLWNGTGEEVYTRELDTDFRNYYLDVGDGVELRASDNLESLRHGEIVDTADVENIAKQGFRVTSSGDQTSNDNELLVDYILVHSGE